MKRHETKKEFKSLAFSVIVLEVAAFISFVTGAGTLAYGIWTEAAYNAVILMSASFMVFALVLFAFGELLQLLMKIELNTRKEESEAKKVVKAVVKEAQKVATVAKKVVKKAVASKKK